jgi:hypothetical protein
MPFIYNTQQDAENEDEWYHITGDSSLSVPRESHRTFIVDIQIS